MEPGDQQRQRTAMEQALVHRRMIEAYAFAITRDFHLADDIYQEVALILLAKPDPLPSGPGFMLWLKEIIRRKSMELLRKRNRLSRMLSDEAFASIAAVLPAEAEDGLAEAMVRCVDKLSGDSRQGIIARYAEGLAVPDIARRLGRSVQGTYAVLKRARLALEECVARAQRREFGT